MKFCAAVNHKYAVKFSNMVFKPAVKIMGRLREVEVISDNNSIDKSFP